MSNKVVLVPLSEEEIGDLISLAEMEEVECPEAEAHGWVAHQGPVRTPTGDKLRTALQQGEQVERAEPNDPPCDVYVLWAVIDRYPPHFVAAFSLGEVELWEEQHEKRKREAEEYAAGWGDEDVLGFFVTSADIPRPEIPRFVVKRVTPEYWRIYDCEKRRTLPTRFPHREEADAEAYELNSGTDLEEGT